MAEQATQTVTSKEDGTPNAQASGMSEEIKQFRYEGAEADPVEPVATDEVVQDAPEAEAPETETEVETPEPEQSKGFNKALQKTQQDNAVLQRRLETLEKLLAAQVAPKPEPRIDPMAEANEVIGQFEKMDKDDVTTGAQVADALKKVIGSFTKALAEKDQQIQEVDGKARASAGEVQFERQWKAQNPTIAASYDAVIEQTNKRMEAKFANIPKNSPEYAAAWHATHDLITENTVSKPKAVVPPPPSTGSRKPVPQAARPAAGRAAAVTPSAKPKWNPFSDNPMDYGLGQASKD